MLQDRSNSACDHAPSAVTSNTRNKMEIRDPIYGFIKINEFEKEIIDTDTFQRLRRIQQLAFSSMAYPGAVHTRFEHSLGVMHLAGLMYDSIIEDRDNRELLHKTLPYGENKDEFKRDTQLNL